MRCGISIIAILGLKKTIAMINIKEKLSFYLSIVIRNIPLGRISYSPEGEDLSLARLLDFMKIRKGFFVDVGAHHPFRFSNT